MEEKNQNLPNYPPLKKKSTIQSTKPPKKARFTLDNLFLKKKSTKSKKRRQTLLPCFQHKKYSKTQAHNQFKLSLLKNEVKKEGSITHKTIKKTDYSRSSLHKKPSSSRSRSTTPAGRFRGDSASRSSTRTPRRAALFR